MSRGGRRRRRYRGRDSFYWIGPLGLPNLTAAGESPPERVAGDPESHAFAQKTGTKGGHTINLHQFANDGVVLLGHLLDVRGPLLILAQDVEENLALADANSVAWTHAIDDHIARSRLDAPPAEPDPLDDARSDAGKHAPATLDLEEAGVSSVIWATGYGFDFRWVHLPVFDERGFPVQHQGMTVCPGLYFLGVPGTR